MVTLQTILAWFETHALAILSTIFMLGAGKWIANLFTGDLASKFVRSELEKFRTELHQNSITSQIQADDAIVNILEATIPEVLHDAGDEIQQAVAAGNLGAVDWASFGRILWAKVEPQIVGGANDYMKNSSFHDEETLVRMVLGRFFKGQAMAAKGLVK